MMPSRRDLLRALLFGCLSAIAAAVAACLPARSPEPSPTPSPSPSPTPSPSPSPTPIPTAELRRLAASLLVVGFRGTTLDAAPWIRSALAEGGLGGVVLFDRDGVTQGVRNIVSPDQVAALVADLRTAAGDRRILVGIDQEGGIVTRLSPKYGFPPVASQASVGAGTTAAARSWAKGLVATLASVGIDLNFAPDVDLNVNPTSPAIGALDRSFSADPDIVATMATIEVEAHRAAGVLTTLKHFPGLGSSTTNTDFGVADVTATWSRTELEPFRRLIAAGHADLVMAAHLVHRGLDPRRPASLSPAVVTDLLRGELGWDGAVITDDLGAAAIVERYERGEAALLALEAGNDLLLYANQKPYDAGVIDEVVAAIVGAVESGRLPVARLLEANARVLALPA